MKYIYIAAPYTKGDPAENTRKAISAGDKLLSMGYCPFIPHLSHYWHLQHPNHYETWMEYDFAWLDKCDALVRLNGYSPGADREVAHAEKSGKPVFMGLSEFILAVS